jgi:uncharacterized membrane protein YphA (DoxX/SURF4 family)
MSVVLLTARLGLALVFAIAAVGKLANRAGFRETLARFGSPPALIGAGAIALPAAELAIAALLIVDSTARAGALAALALLAAFCVALARVLAGGERPDCGCMGSGRSAPVGAGTLVRNAMLGSFAVAVALVGPGEGIGEALADIDASAIALVVVLALVAQAWFSWQLFRQHGRLIARLQALEAAVAPTAPASTVTVLRRVPERAAAAPPQIDPAGGRRAAAG